MAKQANNGSSGGKKGGNGPGATKDRKFMIAESENGRATKRSHRKQLDARREGERQTGEFYTRTNEGRSTDIAAACRGEVGEYAFPGGNEPSLHFNVQKEVGKLGSVSVIRFEAVQYGHELEREVFNPNIFLSCFYVEKFGSEFRSRFEDRLAASTQELICHYMADQLGVSNATQEEILEAKPVETIEQLFDRSQSGQAAMAAMLEGFPGLYGLKTERGIVVMEVFQTNRSNIKVVESTVDGVQPGRYFLPVHLIGHNQLGKVTDDETFSRQLALYLFLRNELTDLINRPAAEKKPTMGKKEQKKLEYRKALKLADANERATEATALANMKAKAITLREAATGKQGWVVMTHSSGEMIVLYGTAGVDKVVQVAHLDDKHILRLAGVDVGSKVYVGQVRAGEIDRIDQANHRLTCEQVKAGNELITHLREQLEASGIKLLSPKRNLRLVKSA